MSLPRNAEKHATKHSQKVLKRVFALAIQDTTYTDKLPAAAILEIDVRDKIDVIVGRLLRERRLNANLTQQEVAASVGVSFQQIQKYESGANRISASRLLKLSEVLGVPVSFFFKDFEVTSEPMAVSQPAPKGFIDIKGDKHALQLLEAFFAMPERKRKQLAEFVHVLASPVE